MRQRFFASSIFLAAFAFVACGSPFEAGNGKVAESADDGGDGSITVEGPDGSTVIVGPNRPGPDNDGGNAFDADADAGPKEDAGHPTDATVNANDDATVNETPDAAADAPDSSPEHDAGPTCTATEKLCADKCVEKSSPATGCGATSCTPCSLAHTATSTCDVNGACAVATCESGFDHCTGPTSGGCETSISTSTNCGSCGHACTVSAPDCAAASGNTFACTDNCPGSTPTLCSNTCVDITSNPADCGGCASTSSSNVCTAPTNGTPTCAASVCGFTCNNGWDKCNNDECVSFTTDPTNCNGCGTKCPVPTHGSATCAPNGSNVGTCGITCNAPYSVCNGTCDDEQTDVNNCGGCTTGGKSYACSPPANSTATCAPPAGNPSGPGTCGFTCNANYQLCNGACVQADPTAVFVSSSSSATSGCGVIGTPCKTIAAGIAYATANGKTHIYVDHGTYPEQVTLTNGLTIEGGWEYGGGSTWSKECVAGVDQSSVTILAPTGVASAVIAKDVTATLSTLTIHNNATASTGESLFGIFAASTSATNDTNLTLDAVEVTVQAGGSGSLGGAGTAPALPTGNVPPCATAGNGATGGAATPVTGFLTTNLYSSAGATPGAGKAANAGNAGANGADPTVTVGSCVTGTVCNAGGNCDTGPEQCGTEGTHGCGGPGGPPGLGGGGGGASIALFAWEATVHVSGGSFTGGKGGNGGAGGNGATVAAAASWTGMNGAAGTGGQADNCKQTVNTCATQKTGAAFTGGPAGESGGTGSAGGNGVSGPGGDSYGYYSGTGASVVVSGSPTFAASSAGTTTGPNPSSPVSGNSAAHN